MRATLAADAALGVAAALLVLAQAVLIAHVAARAFSGASLRAVAVPLVLLVAVVVARSGAAWGFEALGRRAATAVLSQLRMDLVRGRLRDNPAALDGAESAELAATAVAGVDALETAFGRYLPQVVLAIVVPIAVLTLVAVVDPISAGLMLLTLPLVPVFMWLIGRATEERTRERWQALTLLSAHVLDVVQGLPTLRAFNRGEAQTSRIAAVSGDYRRTTMETLRLAFVSGAVLELAATLGVALIAVTAGVRLVDGSLAFVTALTVLLLAPELYLPLRNLAAQYHVSADGLAVTDRLLGLIDAPPLVASGTAVPPSPREAIVRLEGVGFTYPARPDSVLESVDLVLGPGETVALVGPSGGGKSTIAALVLRLAEPTAGRVTVGDVDLAGCDTAAWRAQIAWVPQDPTLFRGTAADNIRLGDPHASDARTRAAARLAGADDFIRGLPDGYDATQPQEPCDVRVRGRRARRTRSRGRSDRRAGGGLLHRVDPAALGGPGLSRRGARRHVGGSGSSGTG